jgi:hypothetical protein
LSTVDLIIRIAENTHQKRYHFCRGNKTATVARMRVSPQLRSTAKMGKPLNSSGFAAMQQHGWANVI